MLNSLRRVAYVLAALCLLAAACGGGDEGGDGGDADNSGGSDDTFGSVSTVGNVAGLSAECESLTNLSIAMTSIFSGSPEEVDRLLDGVRSVPGEIDSEVELLQTAIRSLAEVWSEVGANPLSDPTVFTDMSDADRERIEAVMDEFSDDATDDAFDRIGEYVADECLGFVPGG